MLVSFSVSNFRSFSERQTFSLVAGNSSRKDSRVSFQTSNTVVEGLLKSACVFGANGSGKSNLVRAMDFFRNFVVGSAKNTQEGELIAVYPHLFDTHFKNKPSEFEAVFIHEGTLYQYGFSVTEERVIEEWLFAKLDAPKSRIRSLFHREYDKDSDGYIWDINNTFVRGEKEIWKKMTRENSLFLSQAVQLNAEDFKAPFEWIQKYFRIIDSTTRFSKAFTARKYAEGEWSNKILTLIQAVDTRIEEIDVEKEDFDLNKLPTDVPVELVEMLKENENLRGMAFTLKSLHKDNLGNLVPLGFDEESDGTNVIFGMAGPLVDVLDNGYTLVVDELHNSLHPHALKMLVNLFHDPRINKTNAQLVFTSHETSIMAKDFMHQDQVWIAEKTQAQNTVLVPLSDFRVRDLSKFQKDYLDGRFGGVPHIKDLFYAK